MNTRVILVSEDGHAKQVYINALERLDVHVDIVPSFAELYGALLRTPYHGIMIDLPTKIRAPKSEQELVHEVLELFPVIQLNWEGRADEVRTLYFGQSTGEGTIEEFISEECRSFDPRTIRASERRYINFNVMLSTNGEFDEEKTERTVTVDVSRGGCFLYTIDEWESGVDAWLKLRELSDGAPILAETRWGVPWGEAMKIPGIGVEFKRISQAQLAELGDRYHL